jgi:hypothetical protein
MVQPCTDSSRLKIKNWNERSENRTDWEKSIKEAEEEEEEEEEKEKTLGNRMPLINLRVQLKGLRT